MELGLCWSDVALASPCPLSLCLKSSTVFISSVFYRRTHTGDESHYTTTCIQCTCTCTCIHYQDMQYGTTHRKNMIFKVVSFEKHCFLDIFIYLSIPLLLIKFSDTAIHSDSVHVAQQHTNACECAQNTTTNFLLLFSLNQNLPLS